MKSLKSYIVEKNLKKEIIGVSVFPDNTARLKFGMVDYDELEKSYSGNEWMTDLAKSVTAKTEIQERFTCYVFNTYKDDLKRMDSELTIDSLPVSLKNDKDNKIWITSVKGQVRTIVEFLSKDGWDISNLIAVHYSEDDPITRNILSLHHSLSDTLEKRPKDAIDPSDIIIYDKKKIRNINRWQNMLMSWGGGGKKFLFQYNTLIKYLISQHSYVGVSLKKGDSFTAHYNNYKDAPDGFKDVEIVGIRKNPKDLNIDFSAYNITKEKNVTFTFRIGAQGRKHGLLELKSYKYAQGGKGTWAILDIRNPKDQLDIRVNKDEVIYPKIMINPEWNEKLVMDFLNEPHHSENSKQVDQELFNIFKHIIENDSSNVIKLMNYCLKIGEEHAPYLMVEPT